MKCLGLLLIVMQLLLQPAAGETRFAVMKFREVIGELQVFKAADERLKTEIENIRKDPRFAQMQKTGAELDGVLKSLGKLAPETDRKVRMDLATKAEALRKELDALQTDFDSFEAKEIKRARKEFLEALKPIQSHIRKTASKVAEERGFDCLFEVEGNSNSSVPVMVYMRNPTDITGDVLAALKAEEPPAPDKPAPEKSAASKPETGKPAAKP